MVVERGCVIQAGALAVQDGRLCLVTSRRGKHWVIPKGCLEPGRSPEQSVLLEAWEEGRGPARGILDPPLIMMWALAGELALALDTLAGEALPEKLYPSSKHPGNLDPIQLASLPSRD